MVLSQLYGQEKPASNLIEGFFGKLSSSEYAALSNRFMEIARDVGLNVYKNDGLISGDSFAVDIPATEQGGRLLVRALARFDQVDDRMGGNQAVQFSAVSLVKSMGLDKSRAFMKGMATEAKALRLPWQLEAMLALQTLIGLVPSGASRGNINPNVGRGPGVVIVRPKTPGGGGGNGPAPNGIYGGPYRAPDLPNRTTQRQRPVVAATPASPTSPASRTSPTVSSSTPVTRPATPIPPPSNARLTSAIRIGAVSNDFRSIENPKRFETYINNLNGQPMETVAQIGLTQVSLKAPTLSFRRQFNQGVKFSDLVVGQSPLVDIGIKHDWHLAFGSPSKLGESHASGRAFRIGLKTSWAERGQLPGQGGNKINEFWKADAAGEYQAANSALARLEAFKFDGKLSTFTTQITTPLMDSGFIPQGSLLSKRLERLETSIRTQNALAAEVSKANPSQLAALLPKLNAANITVDAALKQISGQAVQIRGELLLEGLGSPKTTYELTIRQAVGARYMASIEGQPNQTMDAAKFKQIMAAVKAEAGPESTVSLQWHREFVRAQMRSDVFNEAMQESPAMQQAWAAYKAKYGI